VRRTFLLTWHPKRWTWANLSGALDEITSAGVVHDTWSVGNRTDLPVGSRLYLMRLGEDPKGLVGSGWSTSTPRREAHWDPERAASGDRTLRVELDFDVLQESPVLPIDELREAPFASVSWTPQSSGVELSAEVAAAIDERWARTTATNVAPLEDAEIPSGTFPEGALRRVVVNSYERSERARRACIANHGTRCCVCSFSFAATYGPDFQDFIHVHHLRPVSELGAGYQLDPVEDLRPVRDNMALQADECLPSVSRLLAAER
jgi:5-methylcytosine-specific restriction enzyme A